MANFCGKCGSPIDIQTGVCPNCCNNIDDAAKKIKKPTKLLKILIPVVVIVIVISVLSSIFTNINLKISDEEKIVFANNMENASYATFDGKHLYYVVVGPSDDGNSHEYIYRMKLPDGKAKKLAEFSFFPEALYVNDGFVHYENGFASGTINRKNGKNTYVESEGFNEENTLYVNGKCYYFHTEEGYGVYIGKAFGDGEKISDLVVTRAYPCGDYIYLFSSYNSVDNIENTNFGTWRMNLDGSGLTKILDYCPEYFVSDGERLYFKNREHFLVISDLDGSNQERTSTQIGDGLNVKDGVIYFEDYAETGIYSMTEIPLKDLVVSGDVTGIVLAEDYIIYYSNKNICMATLDGSNIKTISEIGSYSDHRF